MPLDGTEFARREIKLIKLDRVISLLDAEEKWCQHQMKTSDGRRCILGALIAINARRQLYGLVVASAREATGVAFTSVEQFNDPPATDHELVIAVLSAARYRLGASDGAPAQIKRSPLLKRFFQRLWPMEI